MTKWYPSGTLFMSFLKYFPSLLFVKVCLDPASVVVSCPRLWSKCEVKKLEAISQLYYFLALLFELSKITAISQFPHL